MRKIIFLLMPMCILYSVSNAQKSNVQKKDMITQILSDTLNPEINLIPVIVKFSNDNSIWLGYDHVLDLYQHFKKQNGWAMPEFERQLRTNLIKGKPFEVAKDDYFKQKEFIPLSECNCLYNENSDKLRFRVSNGNYYKFPDNRFACFVYKCFRNNVVLVQLEMEIGYLNPLFQE